MYSKQLLHVSFVYMSPSNKLILFTKHESLKQFNFAIFIVQIKHLPLCCWRKTPVMKETAEELR